MRDIRKLSYNEIFSQRPNLDSLKNIRRSPIFALVENIRSMHNVGSIFRSSDGALLEKLFLTGYTAKPPRKEIDKTALGATDSVPWDFQKDPLPLIDKFKNDKVQIVVVEHTSASVSYTEADYQFPLCLVMGNEVDGVSQEIVKQADLAIELPMLGLKQSLNVSVAFGIVLYHVLDVYQQLNRLKP